MNFVSDVLVEGTTCRTLAINGLGTREYLTLGPRRRFTAQDVCRVLDFWRRH